MSSEHGTSRDTWLGLTAKKHLHSERACGLMGELTWGVTQQAALATSNLWAQIHLLARS